LVEETNTFSLGKLIVDFSELDKPCIMNSSEIDSLPSLIVLLSGISINELKLTDLRKFKNLKPYLKVHFQLEFFI